MDTWNNKDIHQNAIPEHCCGSSSLYSLLNRWGITVLAIYNASAGGCDNDDLCLPWEEQNLTTVDMKYLSKLLISQNHKS